MATFRDNASHRDSIRARPDVEPGVAPLDARLVHHESPLYWDWRLAFEHDPLANPLQHPDVVLAELAGGRVKSHLNPALICDSKASSRDSFAILIPKTIRTSQVGGVGPEWTLHGLRIAGSRVLGQNLSLDQLVRVLDCATKHAVAVNADFLLFEDLDESTSLFQAVQFQGAHGCLLFEAKELQPRHFIDFPATEDEYWARFSGHCRKLFRKALKKCAGARLERVTDVAQIPDFLDAAHEISRQTWQTKQLGLRIRNDETELRSLTALALQGMLRCYLYRIDGQPAAFAMGNQHGGCFRYEETGFSPELKHYSPGRTMLLEILTDLMRYNPVRSFDFGFGNADYKQQFTNRESRSGTFWLVPPTLRARLSLSHLNICRGIRSAVYTRIKQVGIHAEARQWIRSFAGNSSLQSTSSNHDVESNDASA